MNNDKPCNCSFCSRRRQQRQQQQFWNSQAKYLKAINAEYDKHIQQLPYEKTAKLLRLMGRNNNNETS